MEHCRWWSQCKTLHEYKCFEPGWPSLDCDCAGVCVCACVFAALHVCQHSAAAAALYLLAPAAFTPVLRVKHTHKSDTEMCRRPFWANGESCLSCLWENEPALLQRRPSLTPGATAWLSTAGVTVQKTDSKSQQAAWDTEGCRGREAKMHGVRHIVIIAVPY